VRGHPGLLATWRGNADLEGLSDIVQWIEPPGLLVTVWVDGLDEGERDQLIDGLRASTDAEIDELVATYEPPATSVVRPPMDDVPQPVEIVVAEGDRGANHWRVTAREDHAPPTEVRYEDDYTRFGNEAASAAAELEHQDDGAVAVGGELPWLEVSASGALDDRGEAAVIGSADPAITEIVLEAAGRRPLPLELYRNDELTHSVIVGWVPPAYLGGEVVGLDSRGREIARRPAASPSRGPQGDSGAAQSVPPLADEEQDTP
jgi:hypothetical protein